MGDRNKLVRPGSHALGINLGENGRDQIQLYRDAISADAFGRDGNRCADARCCHDACSAPDASCCHNTCARSRIQYSRPGASSCGTGPGAELRGSEWREVCHGCRGMPATVKTGAVAGPRAANVALSVWTVPSRRRSA